MKKTIHYFICFCCVLIFISTISFAQPACPSVSVTPGNVSMCSGCTTLTATVQGTMATNSYSVTAISYAPFSYNTGTPILVNVDDTMSSVISMPFCFQFFGNTYSQLVIGSNGIITFDITQANTYCNFDLTLSAGIPDPFLLANSIMGPHQDIDPTFLGSIYWQVIGAAPCRAFVVSYYQVPYYGDSNSVSPGSCPNPLFATSQIVLYETTNIIDINILNKDACVGWNSGWGIEGIQDATGTVAYVVPGRNNTVWTATNDSYRFVPTGAPQYVLTWYAPPNIPIGTAPTVSVCPTAATTYTVAVVNNTCSGPITVSAMATVTIGGIASLNVSSTATPCSGSTGTATVIPAGGSAPYTFAWNPGGQTTQTATGLSAGTYAVIVTDAAGCSLSGTVVITSSASIALSGHFSTNVNCFGNNTGSATVNVSNGTPPYTYLWSSTPVQTTQSATGLSAGNYTVIVTDAMGCSLQDTFLISSPSALAGSFLSVVHVSCFGGSNGSITASASGGTSPYTYSWNPSAGTSSAATGLSSGNYTLTVTDSNGCILSDTISISSPLPLSNTFSNLANVDCFGNNIGSAMVNVSGGTLQYTYSWNTIPVQTAQTVTGLFAGVYSVTITDAAGCARTDTVMITSPTTLSLFSPVITHVDCFGNSSGIATVTGTGGTPGYTYSWNPTAQTTPTATGLPAGVYTVSITDNNGCIVKTLVQVTEPSLLTSSVSQINILCFGNNTGTAAAAAAGGTPSYTYLWSNGQPTSSATALTAGNYSVIITDANGCTVTNTVTLMQPASPVNGTVSSVSILCNGDSTGQAAVAAAGGSPPYAYLWSNGQTTTNISNLLAGSYTITFTDMNGCSNSLSVTVTQPLIFTSVISPDTVICLGGSITQTVTPSGGTQAYTYLWMPGGQVMAAVIVAPTINTTYTVQVTDANGCTTPILNTTVNVIQANLANITVSPSTLVFYPATICFTADTGSGINSWNWNMGDSSAAAGVSFICHDYSGAGVYCVSLSVTNNIGCIDTAGVCVYEVETIIPNVFSPNGDGVNDLFVIDVVLEGLTYFNCEIFDRWGIPMALLDKPKEGWDGHTAAGTLASPGTYYFTLSIAWGELSAQKKGFLTLLR
ncbi:MAG: T9SS type B sorting domain-containing protein [Bacteroidetes bacterium]|nr:MAG: T9SS type B sorting domain-containing protein [Bacteroidota bacterium]